MEYDLLARICIFAGIVLAIIANDIALATCGVILTGIGVLRLHITQEN